MVSISANHHVKSIHVTGLFGRYSYRLPASNEQLSELNIIYGENGAGKTTLLTLVFNLLSPSENQGHKTRIANTPFTHLEVNLVDGTKLTATKDRQLLTGPVLFTIGSPTRPRIQWRFIPGPSELKFRVEDLPATIDPKKLPPDIRKDVIYAIEKRDFFAELSSLKIDTFMLTSDRMLLGDKVPEPDRIETQIERARTRAHVADLVREYRVVAVREALSTASGWLQKKFLERSYAARLSVDPYQDVVNKIASTAYKTKSGLNKIQEAEILAALREKTADLNSKATRLAGFGLAATSFPGELLSTIENTHGNKLNLIHTILSPYLDGLQARLNGLMPISELTDKFTSIINEFLRDKRVLYSISEGLKIVVKDGSAKPQSIDSSQLSSGEQQLLLIFCHVLVAQDTSSLIIIDEPEISLNVLWQRTLVSSLHTLSEGANIQFLFASHSLEILSKHRNRVISMQEQQ